MNISFPFQTIYKNEILVIVLAFHLSQSLRIMAGCRKHFEEDKEARQLVELVEQHKQEVQHEKDSGVVKASPLRRLGWFRLSFAESWNELLRLGFLLFLSIFLLVSRLSTSQNIPIAMTFVPMDFNNLLTGALTTIIDMFLCLGSSPRRFIPTFSFLLAPSPFFSATSEEVSRSSTTKAPWASSSPRAPTAPWRRRRCCRRCMAWWGPKRRRRNTWCYWEWAGWRLMLVFWRADVFEGVWICN